MAYVYIDLYKVRRLSSELAGWLCGQVGWDLQTPQGILSLMDGSRLEKEFQEKLKKVLGKTQLELRL